MNLKHILLIVLLFSSIVYGQRKGDNELGLFAGGAFYLGELNHTVFNRSGMALGLVYRHNFTNNRISLRGHGIYGKTSGYDSDSKYDFELNRNLSFFSDIIEVGAQVEFNFFEYEISPERSGRRRNFSPYMFLGLSYFHMNPKTKFNDSKHQLRNLGTEGQSEAYSVNQLAIPFGLGLRLNIGGAWAMSIEWGLRKTFTDYLDDVSGSYADVSDIASENGQLAAQLSDRSAVKNQVGAKRGNPDTKDWYSFYGIIFSYRLGGAKGNCHQYKRF